MTDFTFLTEEQVFGDNSLGILKEYGTECAITDFSILLGGIVSLNRYASKRKSRKNRTGWWWTKSCSKFSLFGLGVTPYGGGSSKIVQNCSIGARPAIPYSSIQSAVYNEIVRSNGIKEVSYGEYPQTVASNKDSLALEKNYNNNTLKITGKHYITDSAEYQNNGNVLSPRAHIEYEYNGKKYIRFVSDSNRDGEVLSNGRIIKAGQAYWVRVEPIIWLVDEEADIALCKKIIFSGVPFHNEIYNGDFNQTIIKQFMDNYFSKEIVTDRVYSQAISVRKQNPYSFNFDAVSEEEIVRGAIESKVPVFLHGKSSDGKSARVKQLDPSCEIIYMRNATPDSLNGKSVYVPPITKRVLVPVKKEVLSDETHIEQVLDTYEYEDVIVKDGYMLDVKPSWLVKVEEKCEREPDKLHIIFFDELTNALPSIQGMAFNIILDGEVNGKWKLPENARIVAAGNDLNDSLAANQMAEPLFNRFAHVYIETTVDSWLKWASTPNETYERIDYVKEEPASKIRPSIYAYVAYKSYSGKDVLRTPYTGEKPNANPRKWEMASKILYKTKQPEMLRALIGDALTKDFVEFTKQQVITLEDVIQHNYSEEDLEMNVSQKFATAVGLSSVDEEHFEVVREFMEQIGAEARAAFESMWAHGDEKRLERIAELQVAKENTLTRRKK